MLKIDNDSITVEIRYQWQYHFGKYDENERTEYVTVIWLMSRNRVCNIKIITKIDEVCATNLCNRKEFCTKNDDILYKR